VRCLSLFPWPVLHFGPQSRCYLLEVLSCRALCPSEKIADVSFLSQDKCQTGTHHDRAAFSHRPQNQGCTTGRPLTLIVFLLCCFRTYARNAHFPCADGKNPERLSPLRLAHGRVPTYFHLSQLHTVRSNVNCHCISFRILMAMHLLSHIRFEASTTASSSPMLDRLRYRSIRRQRREAKHRRPPRKAMVSPKIASIRNEMSFWPQFEG
jgi:hypothetical protein